MAWATAWQEALMDHGLGRKLQRAWQTWVMKLAKRKAPWNTGRGSARAFVATVRRLGWMTQSAHTITINEVVYDMRHPRCRRSDTT